MLLYDCFVFVCLSCFGFSLLFYFFVVIVILVVIVIDFVVVVLGKIIWKCLYVIVCSFIHLVNICFMFCLVKVLYVRASVLLLFLTRVTNVVMDRLQYYFQLAISSHVRLGSFNLVHVDYMLVEFFTLLFPIHIIFS